MLIRSHYNVIIPAGLTYQLDKPSRVGVTKEFHITNKSGVASKHSIIVGACVCDYEYRNEVNINIIGFKPFELKPNFKLAQAIIREVEIPEFECYEVDEDVNIFIDETDRGGGFGVTGNGL